MGEMYPLWMLKYLPNMPACHIAIAQDVRGHDKSITLSEVSSLVTMSEGLRLSCLTAMRDCILAEEIIRQSRTSPPGTNERRWPDMFARLWIVRHGSA